MAGGRRFAKATKDINLAVEPRQALESEMRALESEIGVLWATITTSRAKLKQDLVVGKQRGVSESRMGEG
jgi:hypothetical protein